MDRIDDYDDLLRFGGAKVLAYEAFGSYQGDWIAKVRIKFRVKWIHGGFGSCSGCDAIQSETEHCSHHWEQFKNDCDKCQECVQGLKRLAAEYIAEATTFDDVFKEISKHDWDSETPKMVKWMEANR